MPRFPIHFPFFVPEPILLANRPISKGAVYRFRDPDSMPDYIFGRRGSRERNRSEGPAGHTRQQTEVICKGRKRRFQMGGSVANPLHVMANMIPFKVPHATITVHPQKSECIEDTVGCFLKDL